MDSYNEAEMQNNETERVRREENRINNETERINNEANRVANEIQRIAREDIRQGFYNDFNSRIKEVGNEIFENEWYKPREMEETLLGYNGIPDDYSSETYEGFYDWSLNKLLSENPNYVSKQILGKDTSDTYNIYRYDFTPEKYEKTILLVSCLHGNEYTSFFGMCRFLEELCNNPNNDINIKYLRNKIKIVVVPIANPWGFVNSNRRNVNGVDLNRNFDYRWNEYTTQKSQQGQVYYKGSSPFSENETSILKDLFDELHSDNCNFVSGIDFHTIASIEAEKILYYPRFHDNAINQLANVVKQYNYGENRAIFGSSSVPTLANYLSWEYNVNCCNPEWNNPSYGTSRTSENMTQWCEFMGNIILAMCKNTTAPNKSKFEPFLKCFRFTADETLEGEDENRMSKNGYKLVSSNFDKYYNMEISKYDLLLDGQYIIKLTGTVQISVKEDTTIHLQPMLYQRYAPEQNYSTISDDRNFEIVFDAKGGQEYFIPVNACIQGFHSNYNSDTSSRTDIVHFRLRAYCTTVNSSYIKAYTLFLNGIPSERGIAVESNKVHENGIDVVFPSRIPEDIDD